MEKKYNFMVTIELNEEDTDMMDARVVEILNNLTEITGDFLKSRTDIISWDTIDEFITFEVQDTLHQQNETVVVELNFEVTSKKEIDDSKYIELQDGLWGYLEERKFDDRHEWSENEGSIGIIIWSDEE